MKNIPLFWFKKEGKHGNFGDELGPYLIGKLSRKEVYRIPIPRTSFKLLGSYFKGLLTGAYKLKVFKNVMQSLYLNGNYIISVGSIIDWGSGKRIVWGSGILFENSHVDNGDFRAVRGKRTRNRLLELGYSCPEVYGDPALLLPLVYKPQIPKSTDKIGLIPHHTQYDYFKKYESLFNVKVINLIGDIEFIIDEIVSCKFVMSTSLHGVIVSQAYDVPALWYKFPEISFRGEDVKYYDYFSSVGIEDYAPFTLEDEHRFSLDNHMKNFLQNQQKSKIQFDLKKIQKSLLDSAPFPIVDDYLI